MSGGKKIRVGVIGAGRIGQVHAEHLKYRIPQAELVAIADVNSVAAKTLADKLSVDHRYSDYHEILSDPTIEAVIVCSSTDTHAKIIEEAAAAGKHIFCEKPIDHELSKIDRALSAVTKYGVKLQIGFNRRFDPNFRHVYESIRAGKIGDPHILHIISRDPGLPPIEYLKVSGGLFLDMAIHDFDMARYLIGSEVIRVSALGAVHFDEKIKQFGDVDTALTTLEFANGVFATIDNSRQAAYGYDQRAEVFGSLGSISTENITPQRTVLSNREGIHNPLPLNFFMDRYIQSYVTEMTEFIESIINDTPPPVTGKDGRMPVVVALAAKRSLTERRPVAMDEIEETVAR